MEVSRRSNRWWLWYAIVLAAITSFPYLSAAMFDGRAWSFTGFVFGVEDGNSYIAKMLLGASGDWLFRTPYTTSPQRGVLAFLPYLLLGKMASGAALHEQLVCLYHLARVLAIPLVVWATDRFLRLFVPDESWRRWAVILATAGGGLGWLLVLLGKVDWLGSLPLDLYSPESFGFLAIYGLPHLIVARALLLCGLTEYLSSPEKIQGAWRAGLAWLAMGLFQPLSVVSALAVLLVHLVALAVVTWRQRDAQPLRSWVLRAGCVALATSPVLVYNLIAFSTDPFLKAWTEQNRILSPHPWHYLVAYALLFIPAVLGGRAVLRERRPEGYLLLAWSLALPVLAYVPHNLQRRLPEGIWVAIVALGAIGLERSVQRVTQRRWIQPAILLPSLLSSAFLLAGGEGVGLQPAMPAFRPGAEVAAFEWLASNASPGDVALASYATSNALPAWAPVRVLIGHGPESVGLEELEPAVEAFFGSMDEAGRMELLREHQVSYLFWGPEERALGAWSPYGGESFNLVYASQGYQIYAVDLG
jgi:hypothetical protein